MEGNVENLKKVNEFENVAIEKMDKYAKYYYCAGAATCSIPRDNEEALAK